MSIVDLLALFADPARLQELTLAQKMLASLVTTVLGMGITFLALIILQLVITLMAKVSAAQRPARTQPSAGAVSPEKEDGSDEDVSREVVAAITVSLAVMLERSPRSLVIRNIRKIEDSTPAWSRAGLVEQMHHNV